MNSFIAVKNVRRGEKKIKYQWKDVIQMDMNMIGDGDFIGGYVWDTRLTGSSDITQGYT